MTYKLYTSNIELKPRETKIVKFPWGYFKRKPTVNLTSTSNVYMSINEVTKNYFSITNPTSIRIIVSYSAILKRDQKVLRVYSDIDGDNIPDILDEDIDGDGFTNNDENIAGTDPYDPNSFPVEPDDTYSLYIGLITPVQTDEGNLISFYSDEMNDLTYPTLINLQPDSNSTTQYEIITDPSVNDTALEPQRIRNINLSTYNNTTPASSIFRIDNLSRNKNYKIYSISSYNEFNVPNISAAFKVSSSNNEDEHTFLGNLNSADYQNLINFTNTNVFEKQYWIHNLLIDNNNDVIFTEGSQQEAKFAFSGSDYLLFHTQYTSNSNGTAPDIEIAIQTATSDGSDDGQNGGAGYFSNYFEEEVNGAYPFQSATINDYTSINTNLNSDENTENHARFVAEFIIPRIRYRMHVKVGNGTDCNFNAYLNVQSMIDFTDLDSYNNNYDQNSNLTYYSLIPNDGLTNERTYYHYFTIREDGFIVWENNLAINA